MRLEDGVVCGGRFTPDGGGPEVPLQELIERRRSDGWRYAGMVPRDRRSEVGPYEVEEDLEATVVPTEVVVRWEPIGGDATGADRR